MGIVNSAKARCHSNVASDASDVSRQHDVITKVDSQKHTSKVTKKSTAVTPKSNNMNAMVHTNTKQPDGQTLSGSRVDKEVNIH